MTFHCYKYEIVRYLTHFFHLNLTFKGEFNWELFCLGNVLTVTLITVVTPVMEEREFEELLDVLVLLVLYVYQLPKIPKNLC